jgi:hypothetical protein
LMFNSLVNDRRRFTLGFLEGMGAPFRGRPSLTFCSDLGAHHHAQTQVNRKSW